MHNRCAMTAYQSPLVCANPARVDKDRFDISIKKRTLPLFSNPMPAGSAQNNLNLNCVALPILHHDVQARLGGMLKIWADARFFPRLSHDAPRPHLLIVINDAGPETLAAAQAALDPYPGLKSCFSGVSARSAGLVKDRDLYTKRRNASEGAYGTRAGPNFLFQATMRMAAEFGGFTLQMELDCLPVQAGWLEQTQQVIDGHQRAWVIGSHYAGVGELDRTIQEHLNGNALYHTGNRSFQSFVSRVWMPRLLRHAQVRRDLAYDCWWALERSQATAIPPNDSWELFQTFSAFIQADPFIVNLVSPAHAARDYIAVFEKFRQLGRTPVFFHGSAMNKVCDALLADPKIDVFQAIDHLSPPKAGRGGLPQLQRAGADIMAEVPQSESPKRQTKTGPEDSLADLGAGWSDSARASARILLRDVTARMLIKPDAIRSSLTPPHPLAHAVAGARAIMDENDPVLQQFERVVRAYV